MTQAAPEPREFVQDQDGAWHAVVSWPRADGAVPVLLRYRARGGRLEKVSGAGLRWLVPDAITARALPRAAAAQLIREGGTDAITQRAAHALRLLVDAGVPADALGVSGSLLLGAHGPRSDIDLVIHGRTAFQRARSAVAALVARGALRWPHDADWRDAWERRGATRPFEEFLVHERRKGTRALVDGTRLDLTMVPAPAERWHAPGMVVERALEITARVTDASAGFDLPARFAVEHPEVHEVVVWTNTYVGQAETGETIEAAGILERDALGCGRLIVGTSREAPGEFVRVPALTSPARGTSPRADPP